MRLWSFFLILVFPMSSQGESNIVDTGAIYLESCTLFNSNCDSTSGANCGTCQFRVMHTTTCSREAPCDNLVVFWDDYGCESDDVTTFYSKYLTDAPDFVIACVQPLYPGEILPSSLGAPERDNVLLSKVLLRLSDAKYLGVWNGKNLLMAGCSAAGSRYPSVAARYPDDAYWVGSGKNAVCMSDGVVDIVTQDRFDGEGANRGFPSCLERHERIASGYTLAEPLVGHGCQNSPGGQCACDPASVYIEYENDCGGGSCIEFDSVVTRNDATGDYSFSSGISADDYAIKNWRLISEGSDWEFTSERCDNDRVPEEPYRGLCNAIDAGPEHSCEHISRPQAHHCTYFDDNFASVCLDWFRKLPVPVGPM